MMCTYNPKWDEPEQDGFFDLEEKELLDLEEDTLNDLPDPEYVEEESFINSVEEN